MSNRSLGEMTKEEFLVVDRLIFDRLNSGPQGPVHIVLKSGVTVVGETKGIARGASDGRNAAYWGRILIAASDGRDVEVDYTAVADIS